MGLEKLLRMHLSAQRGRLALWDAKACAARLLEARARGVDGLDDWLALLNSNALSRRGVAEFHRAMRALIDKAVVDDWGGVWRCVGVSYRQPHSRIAYVYRLVEPRRAAPPRGG